MDCILVAIEANEFIRRKFQKRTHNHANRLNDRVVHGHWKHSEHTTGNSAPLKTHSHKALNFHGNSNERFFGAHYNKFYLLPIWKRFLYYLLFDEILPQNDSHLLGSSKSVKHYRCSPHQSQAKSSQARPNHKRCWEWFYRWSRSIIINGTFSHLQ